MGCLPILPMVTFTIAVQIPKDTYDKLASKWDEIVKKNSFYRSQRETENEMFSHWILGAQNEKKALDIGCGTGNHTIMLLEKGYDTTAIDVSKEMLEITKNKIGDYLGKRVNLLKLKAENIDSLQTEFQVIISLGSVVNHFKSWEEFFEKIEKLLKKDGIFLFSLDNLLGIDSFILTIEQLLSKTEVSAIQEFARSIKCYFKGEYFSEEWQYQWGNRVLPTKLIYLPPWRVKKMLRQSGIQVLEIRGANIFSSFLPSIVRSSWDLDAILSPRTKRLEHWTSKIDSKVGRILYFLGAQLVIAGRKA